MNLTFDQKIDFERLIGPETSLESMLIAEPEFQAGYHWGIPRFGHPEGKVGLHVREVLDNVELLDTDAETRRALRLITIVHDTFKFREDKDRRNGAFKHHGLMARQFVEGYLNEQSILDIIELHDEAYYVWRGLELEKNIKASNQRFDVLLKRLEDNLPLFHFFFKCDTQTGDKIQAPLKWFERWLKNSGMEF